MLSVAYVVGKRNASSHAVERQYFLHIFCNINEIMICISNYSDLLEPIGVGLQYISTISR